MTLSRVALFEHAAVASEQPLASMAGYEALRANGNAFDAAVATSFALAVTFQAVGGLGGDFFAMMHEARTGRVYCLNSSGWAPSGMTGELIRSRGMRSIPAIGPYSVVVPGLVAGVMEVHKRFGELDAKKLLAPALRYAREGYPAGEGICESVSGVFDTLSPSARKIFAPSGRPPVPGEWIVQNRLAEVIEGVMEGGPDAFYKGWPAETIAARLTELGVPAKKSDFEFKPEWVEPLTLDYRGTTVWEVPPNSMGATCLLMLKELATKELNTAGPLSRERIELTMEAAEFAYERKDRMLGDPRFYPVDMAGFMRLDGTRPQTRNRILRGGDTTAFSVADSDGNLVSAIQSLYHHFGSCLFVEDCGIMMNSRGAGFSMSGPNAVEPLKRPLHTLSSILVKRGEDPPTAVGTSGGDYRPMQHTLFITNMVDYAMSPEQSTDHPRFLWSGGRLLATEAGYQTSGLGGYDIESMPYPGRAGVCHSVQVLPRAKKAICDVRGDGVPAGY